MSMCRFGGAAVGQILYCQREGGNINDPSCLYAVAIVKNNDTPIDNDAPSFNGSFTLKLSQIASKP